MIPLPRMRSLPILAAGFLLLGLACLRTATPVVFHTLHAVSPQEGQPGSGPALAVEVLPIRLPGVLQRPQIVTSLGPNSLELSSGHQWGNALEKDIQRVLVENLSALLGSNRVVASPYGTRVNAVYRVEVDVQRCEGRPGGTFSFQATWMITGSRGDMALVMRKTTLEEPVQGPDPEALVAAHNRALAALSREIAEGLKGQP